jgi:hypothetical protein
MAKPMGDGSRKVIRDFRYSDPQTGETTTWTVGVPYTGRMDIQWLSDPNGPDGRGPLIDAPAPVIAAKIAEKPISLSDSNKEK